MCYACGLPTTHTSFWQTVSLTSLLMSGVLSFLWVYMILSRTYLKNKIRSVLDKIFPSNK